MTHQETVTKQRRERERRQLELKKEQDKVADLEKDLEQLREQRNALVLASPHDGIVVHGALTRGRLGEKPSHLEAGSSVSPDQVVVTVLDPSSLKISVDVPEDQLAKVKEGMKVTVLPSVAQQQSISGTVQQISSIPYAGTKFDATVSCKLEDGDLIRPTMTCKVEITP